MCHLKVFRGVQHPREKTPNEIIRWNQTNRLQTHSITVQEQASRQVGMGAGVLMAQGLETTNSSSQIDLCLQYFPRGKAHHDKALAHHD